MTVGRKSFIHMSVYITIIENGVLKKYIPGLCIEEITLPDNIHTVAPYCMSPWSPDVLPLGEVLNSWDEYCMVKTISIPKNVVHVEKLAFADIPNLKKFAVEKGCEGAQAHKGVLYSGDGRRLICYPPMKRGEYTITNGVEIISENAFENTRLSQVWLPDSIKKIEDDAFTGGMLRSIYIPWSVTSIGDRVFDECKFLHIKTPWNSYALKYAKAHGIPCEEVLYYL